MSGSCLKQRRLDELFFEALRELIAHCEQTHNLARAFQYAQRALRADPLREEAHRELICLHIAARQPGAALRQYPELERRLAQELGIAPAAETRSLIDAIEPAELSIARGGEASDAQPAVPIDEPHYSRVIEARTLLPAGSPEQWEPVGGAVPLDSQFYVVRPTDDQFRRRSPGRTASCW